MDTDKLITSRFDTVIYDLDGTLIDSAKDMEVAVSRVLTDHGLPLPHMGWNRVYAKAGDRLFRGIEDGAYFYFVHSYAMPVNAHTIAQCNYGEAFTAAVQKDNFFGVQFHPERSGAAGAQNGAGGLRMVPTRIKAEPQVAEEVAAAS